MGIKMTEKEKMILGMNYYPMDPELGELKHHAKILLKEYNQTLSDEGSKRIELLKKLLGSCTEMTLIEPDFRCDYGFNIHASGLVFVNYNCVMLDVCKITIGENVFIGPNTSIVTACHPILPEERLKACFGKPVTIGDNVWIGANCTILPGVTIGEGSVIGAGSVVTKDIPERVVAVGNPCRVLRNITEKDTVF